MNVLDAYSFIHDRLEPLDLVAPSVTESKAYSIKRCESYDDLCSTFSSHLHMTSETINALSCMLATVISTEIGSDQLWMRVIGPPGSGKTTLAECIAYARDYVYPLDIFTGIQSGWRGDRGKDAGLADFVRNKTVIIKDGDTLVQAPNRDELMAQLRAFYDRSLRAHYRNMKRSELEDISSTFIICATDEIRTLDHVLRGARFLDVEIFNDGNAQPYLDAAMTNSYHDISRSFAVQTNGHSEAKLSSEDRQLLREYTAGFIHHKKTALHLTTVPSLPERSMANIKAIATLLAYVRAGVRRGRDLDIEYKPRKELATRLSNQFTKLAICLAYIMDRPTVDTTVLQTCYQVAMDSGYGWRLDAMKQLVRKPKGVENRMLSNAIGVSESQARRLITDMIELRIARRNPTPNGSTNRGRHLHLFQLTPEVRSLWTQAKPTAEEMIHERAIPKRHARPRNRRRSSS